MSTVSARFRQYWQHEMAAVGEGLCPVHGTPLEASAAPDRRIAGHCTACRRFWGVNLDTQETGWWRDDNPARPGQPATVPDWMTGGQP